MVAGIETEEMTTVVISLVAASVVAIIAYFLRKIDAKIEANTQDIIAIRVQTASFASEMGNGAIQAFNAVCKERQGSCSLLHGSRFQALEEGDRQNCQKITHLQADRKEAWKEQRRWNEKIEEVVYNHNNRKEKGMV